VVHFRSAANGVMVVADVAGLEPNSKHGFHIHEYGDAAAPDGTSAGGHYDPEGTGHHDRPNAEVAHHAGDMGNLTADGNGKAHYEMVIANITIAGRHNPILGRSVIVHAEDDDFGQPTGNAGPRAGVGVIGIAAPEKK
jgi:Cu-Zn family superoxide dismutase